MAKKKKKGILFAYLVPPKNIPLELPELQLLGTNASNTAIFSGNFYKADGKSHSQLGGSEEESVSSSCLGQGHSVIPMASWALASLSQRVQMASLPAGP